MQPASVELIKVDKSYGDHQVVFDLSLVLPANTTTAIVGESGSGKSTLLQLVNGLVVPERGEVMVFGEPLDYTRLPEVRRRMGYAVQGAGLFPHLTVFQNVTLMARLADWSAAKIRARYEYLLSLLELDAEFSDRYPHSLSGGQQQRVSLCRAMMLNPPLMLLDEPFSALDPITRAGIHDEFVRLQAAESRTILLVTHDMGEAMKLSSHVVILKDGRIEQEGDIQTVQANPASDYVASLLAMREVR